MDPRPDDLAPARRGSPAPAHPSSDDLPVGRALGGLSPVGRALVGVAVLVGWQACVYGLGSASWLRWQPAWFPGLGAVVVNLCGAALVCAIAAATGLLRASGLTTWGLRGRWPWLAPVLVIAGSFLLPGITGSTGALVSSAVVLLSVGLSEEIAARGVALEFARGWGEVRAVTLLAVVFGLGHVGNHWFFGASAEDTFWQILSSTALGFAFGALRLLIGSLWPLIVLHAAYDWAQVNSPGAAPLWAQIFIMAAFGTLGALALAARRRERTAAGEVTEPVG